MVELLSEDEARSAPHPSLPWGLTPEAQAQDLTAIWERVEAYIRTRYATREVVWILRGEEDEEWIPPLSPVTSHVDEFWAGGVWVPADLEGGPLGLRLSSSGTFRVTAQVGDGDAPQAVLEAFRRLAEYGGAGTGQPGVSSYSVEMAGALKESYQRNPSHDARALQYSGAADLLRPYRRQK